MALLAWLVRLLPSKRSISTWSVAQFTADPTALQPALCNPLQVLERAWEVGMRAIRGNHDDMALAALQAWAQPDAHKKDVPHGKKKCSWVLELDRGRAAEYAEKLQELPYMLEVRVGA